LNPPSKADIKVCSGDVRFTPESGDGSARAGYGGNIEADSADAKADITAVLTRSSKADMGGLSHGD
jgi:hypothetical protein